jgi:hypothetical protein
MVESSTDRGVSEVLGYVLVFSLVLTAIVLVSVPGVSGLENVRRAEQADNADTAFDVLHDNMAELHSEGAPSRATEMELADSQLFVGESVTVRIHLYDGTWDNDTTYRVRPLIQRLDGERRLVYEAGAVFRTTRQSGVLFREPPVLSRDGSVHITVPATRATAGNSLGGGTALVRGEVTDRDVPVSDTDDTYTTVVYNVTSPRADLWHDHLETEGFDCSDPADGTTECQRDSFSRLYVSVQEIELSLVR